MGWEDYKGKKVYLQINTSCGERNYTGTVEEVIFMGKNSEGVETYFLEIISSKGNKIGFISSSIKLIQEEK